MDDAKKTGECACFTRFTRLASFCTIRETLAFFLIDAVGKSARVSLS